MTRRCSRIHRPSLIDTFSYTMFASTGRWFVTMNFCIHTIMYGYFALRAARVRVPRSVQQSITFLQLAQMIAGCIVNVSAFRHKQQGQSCATTDTNIVLSLALYGSYLILFGHFFYTSYMQRDPKNKLKDRAD
jgi:elongation of very long chain fatty acids protein 6